MGLYSCVKQFFKEDVRQLIQRKYRVYFYCEESFEVINPNSPMELHMDRTVYKWMRHIVYITMKVAAASFLGVQFPVPIDAIDDSGVDLEVEADNGDFRFWIPE